MRGGRNKFGPMYKRDRARKLQVIRERQLTTGGSGGPGSGTSSSGGAGGSGLGSNGPNGSNAGRNSSSSPGSSGGGHGPMAPAMYAPMADVGYSPAGANGVYGVKHEIQIAQVSSLTSSPDSSPSPMTTATLGYPGSFAFPSH